MSDAKSADAAAPKKGKRKLFLILGVVLVLAIAGGAAAFLMLKKSHAGGEGGDAAATQAAEKKDVKKDDKPPVFVLLEAFTVRLQTDSGDSYLQTVPELRVASNEVAEKVKGYMPELRHRGLLVIAAKKPADVTTPDGVQQLANELRVTFNNVLAGKDQPLPPQISNTAAPDDPIQEVLFTTFIVQ